MESKFGISYKFRYKGGVAEWHRAEGWDDIESAMVEVRRWAYQPIVEAICLFDQAGTSYAYVKKDLDGNIIKEEGMD